MNDRYERWQPLLVMAVIALCVAASARSIGAAGFSAQQTPQTPQQGDPRSPSSAGLGVTGGPTEASIDYKISPGDVIDIQVDRAPELSGSYRVTAAGVFHMNYLGEVVAKGKTQEELASLIADGLRGGYLKNPRVMVVVKPLVTPLGALFIQGAVRSPGVYQIQGRASLLKLISQAGGLDPNHGSTAFVLREIKPSSEEVSSKETGPLAGEVSPSTEASDKSSPTYEMTHQANVNALYKGDLKQDVVLESGDIVIIPDADVFFVAGEVGKPGSFPLREGTTLSQAISLAEGTTFKSAGRGFIIRDDQATGKRVEIAIDIKAAMKGRNDILIQPNDIIRVPSSGLKSAASYVLSAFGHQVTNVPIYRRRY